VIRSFRDKETQALYEGRLVRRFRGFATQAELSLDRLDSATALADLAQFRGNRLKRLRGDRTGQYSIRINDQWQICFSWRADGPHDVEIVDYH